MRAASAAAEQRVSEIRAHRQALAKKLAEASAEYDSLLAELSAKKRSTAQDVRWSASMTAYYAAQTRLLERDHAVQTSALVEELIPRLTPSIVAGDVEVRHLLNRLALSAGGDVSLQIESLISDAISSEQSAREQQVETTGGAPIYQTCPSVPFASTDVN